MLVLFDNGTPRTLARSLISRHTVTEARARGWDRLENGALLTAAESAGFDVLVTTDKNIRYQQNLTGREIAIVVLERVGGASSSRMSSASSPRSTTRRRAASQKSRCPTRAG